MIWNLPNSFAGLGAVDLIVSKFSKKKDKLW